MRAAVFLGLVGLACSGSSRPDGGVDAGPMPHCDDIFGDRKTQVCLRWSCDRRSLSEGAWAGDAGACEAGAVSIDGYENSLKLVNLYRWLAELPEVTTSSMRDGAAQQCAVMMHAAGRVDQMPATTFPCWSQAGAEAARNSIIALTPPVAAVDGHMGTLSSRRWLMNTTLGPIGIGGTSGASCHWVSGGMTGASKRFVAWPPGGVVPLDALTQSRVDEAGWTVETFSSAADLSGATVAVRDNGADAPVDVTVLPQNEGSAYAVSFKPRGWTTQAGHEYVVNVVAPAIQANPIVYTVQVVGCP